MGTAPGKFLHPHIFEKKNIFVNIYKNIYIYCIPNIVRPKKGIFFSFDQNTAVSSKWKEMSLEERIFGFSRQKFSRQRRWNEEKIYGNGKIPSKSFKTRKNNFFSKNFSREFVYWFQHNHNLLQAFLEIFKLRKKTQKLSKIMKIEILSCKDL
jgi:hypothetical protein